MAWRGFSELPANGRDALGSVVLGAQAEGGGLQAVAHVEIVIRLQAPGCRLAVVGIAGLATGIDHFGEGRKRRQRLQAASLTNLMMGFYAQTRLRPCFFAS